jgi:hypothetical protein
MWLLLSPIWNVFKFDRWTFQNHHWAGHLCWEFLETTRLVENLVLVFISGLFFVFYFLHVLITLVNDHVSTTWHLPPSLNQTQSIPHSFFKNLTNQFLFYISPQMFTYFWRNWSVVSERRTRILWINRSDPHQNEGTYNHAVVYSACQTLSKTKGGRSPLHLRKIFNF